MENDVAVSPYNTQLDVLKDFKLPQKIVIYDSTLRDGEQMPGISFSPDFLLGISRFLSIMLEPPICFK